MNVTDFYMKNQTGINDFLDKHQFSVIDEHQDPSFGNMYVIVKNIDMSLRFVRDKSQYFLDIKTSQDAEWHQFSSLLNFLNLKIPNIPSLEAMISLLSEHYGDVSNLLRNEKAYKNFLDFDEKRSIESMNKIFGEK